jgi:type I restriction enzyme S subunit
MVPNGWKHGRVSDVVDLLESGVSVNGEDRPKDDGEIGVLRISAVTYGTFNPVKYKTVIPKDVGRAKLNPKKGQILISRSNTDTLVGASCYINKDYPELFLPDKLWQTMPNKASKVDTLWLSYLLASKHVRYRLSKLATGTSGSMKNITKGELLTLPIDIPPPTEQIKIAQILSTWDKAIATVEKLIENSKQQKKALMQQLLTGKKRFKEFGEPAKDGGLPEGWELKALKEVVSKERKITYGIVVPGPYEDGGNYMIRAQDYSKGWNELSAIYRVSSKVDESYKRSRVNSGDILLTIVGSIGNLAKVPENLNGANLTQQTARLAFDDHSSEYYLAVMQSDVGRKQIYRFAKSGVQPSLNLADVAKFLVQVPPLKEQEKIGATLVTSDLYIEKWTNKLDYLKAEKKSLMQQLLTGKRRVKVDSQQTAEATA